MDSKSTSRSCSRSRGVHTTGCVLVNLHTNRYRGEKYLIVEKYLIPHAGSGHTRILLTSSTGYPDIRNRLGIISIYILARLLEYLLNLHVSNKSQMSYIIINRQISKNYAPSFKNAIVINRMIYSIGL